MKALKGTKESFRSSSPFTLSRDMTIVAHEDRAQELMLDLDLDLDLDFHLSRIMRFHASPALALRKPRLITNIILSFSPRHLPHHSQTRPN